MFIIIIIFYNGNHCKQYVREHTVHKRCDTSGSSIISFLIVYFCNNLFEICDVVGVVYPYTKTMEYTINCYFLYNHLQKMRQFQKTLEDLGSRVASTETLTQSWQTPQNPNDAAEQMQHLQRLKDKMTTAGALLDDCNEQQGFFTANHVLVPTQCLAKLEDLNTR